MTVAEVFGAAALKAHGPVRWLEMVAESSPGVYVVAVVAGHNARCEALSVSYLPREAMGRWIAGQPVVYIGRTRRAISLRLQEFFNHKHGNRSPHRGGQDVKLLTCPLWVFWCPTDNPTQAEDRMIEAFKKRVGRLPFANRMRSARIKKPGTTGGHG
jgi:hypothetical protein